MPQGSSPQRIGRYEVIGHLASGGMAEVLLGRLRGPHGFERPVVIKRILPHLALDPTIVDMFLDEARIIANLRHPNLIHVHELGREDDQLFMVMEYLEGESLAGLCRRLASRGMQIDLALAAHIVSEACAGLHAAHEATSPDGRPLEIVHRDVSPQNVFVEYSGAVRVIDFGIATTADRVSRTEAGTVRGKFEYLAPEQLHGIPLDRRADVFALGVVLFELASGRRLFKRESQAATMMAVLKEDPPPLASFRPDALAELEAISMRALRKGRSDRHATAAEMRAELRAFIRGRTGQDLPEELGRLMRTLFADRIAEKREMLRRVQLDVELPPLPAADVDLAVELPTVAASSGNADIDGTSRRKASRARWLLSTAALLVVGFGAAGVAGQWRASHPSAIPAATGTAEAALASAPPPESASIDPPSVPSAAPSPTASHPLRAGSRPPSRQAPPAPRPGPTVW